MPELPEIVCRAQEMNQHLVSRRIVSIDVKQPKCLNVTVEAFVSGLVGAEIGNTSYHGKWLRTATSQGHLLINLGMGGELLLVDSGAMPEKWRVRFDLDIGLTLAVNFWWFGHTHYVKSGHLAHHAMTCNLGPNALDVSSEEFYALLAGRRGRIKSFLLNQKNIAGIGNAYVHDILFSAKLHPLRPIPTLTAEQVERLHQSIRAEFDRSIAKGAANYELNLFGERGRFGAEDLCVGYREGKACPGCGSSIEKLKTGSTTSYFCPKCQLM